MTCRLAGPNALHLVPSISGGARIRFSMSWSSWLLHRICMGFSRRSTTIMVLGDLNARDVDQ